MKLRRTWGQRINLMVSALLIVGLLTAASGLLFASSQTGEVQRVAITVDGGGTLAKVENVEVDPMTLLVVGVDNASGLQDGDSVLVGRDPTSMLTDTILIVRLDPRNEVVHVMSIPRDLWVPIAGTGRSAKINSAMAIGGPSVLVQTIQDSLGVEVNHFIQVNFAGFRNAVDALGGVPVVFETPAKDTNSGLAVAEPGCVFLDGQQALGFVRSRYYQAEREGVWVSDPLSDRSRVQRQQLFVRAAVAQAIQSGARNPFQLQRLFNSIKDEVVLDDTLSVQRLFGVADKLRETSSENIEFFTLPTEDGWVGDAAVALLLPNAADMVAEFNATATVTEVKADVSPEGVPVTPESDEVPEVNIFIPRVPGPDDNCVK